MLYCRYSYGTLIIEKSTFLGKKMIEKVKKVLWECLPTNFAIAASFGLIFQSIKIAELISVVILGGYVVGKIIIGIIDKNITKQTSR